MSVVAIERAATRIKLVGASTCHATMPDSSPDPAEAEERLAQRRFYLAVAFGNVPLVAKYVWEVLHDGIFWEVVMVFGAVAFAVGMPIVLLLGLPVLEVAGECLRRLFARHVPAAAWRTSLHRSLWTLPYAGAMAAVLGLLYFALHVGFVPRWGGWIADFSIGTAANLLGAWCAGTILLDWFRLRQLHVPGRSAKFD